MSDKKPDPAAPLQSPNQAAPSQPASRPAPSSQMSEEELAQVSGGLSNRAIFHDDESPKE